MGFRSQGVNCLRKVCSLFAGLASNFCLAACQVSRGSKSERVLPLWALTFCRLSSEVCVVWTTPFLGRAHWEKWVHGFVLRPICLPLPQTCTPNPRQKGGCNTLGSTGSHEILRLPTKPTAPRCTENPTGKTLKLPHQNKVSCELSQTVNESLPISSVTRNFWNPVEINLWNFRATLWPLTSRPWHYHCEAELPLHLVADTMWKQANITLLPHSFLNYLTLYWF